MKKKKNTNDDLTPEQARYYRNILMEEMIRKIERRIEESDENVLKSIKTFMADAPIEVDDGKDKQKKVKEKK